MLETLIPVGVVALGAYLTARWADRRQFRERRYALAAEQRAAFEKGIDALEKARSCGEDAIEQWRLDEGNGAGCSQQGFDASQRYLDSLAELRAAAASIRARTPVESASSDDREWEPAYIAEDAEKAGAALREMLWRHRSGESLSAHQQEVSNYLEALTVSANNLVKLSGFTMRLPKASDTKRPAIDWSQFKQLGPGE